jgi:hypothetical protein
MDDGDEASRTSYQIKTTTKEDKDLRKKIQQLYQKGYSRTEIFLILFYQYFNEEFSDEVATEWFRCIDEGVEAQDIKDKDRWRLIMVVVDEVQRLKYAISKWPPSNVTPKFLNSRYALQIENSSRQLFLLDNFHGMRR